MAPSQTQSEYGTPDSLLEQITSDMGCLRITSPYSKKMMPPTTPNTVTVGDVFGH